MCFAHSGSASDSLHVQAGIGTEAAAAFSDLARLDGLTSVDIAGQGTPDTVAVPHGDRVVDGCTRVLTTGGTAIWSRS